MSLLWGNPNVYRTSVVILITYVLQSQVILIGDSSVGKTSILSRFSDQVFSSNFISTVGIDFKVKKIKRDKRKVKLQVMNGNVAAFKGTSQLFHLST